MEEFNIVKKAELLQVAQHFQQTVNDSLGKGEIKKIALNELVEDFFKLKNVNMTRDDYLEITKLEFQESKHEAQVRQRVLEIREMELATESKEK